MKEIKDAEVQRTVPDRNSTSFAMPFSVRFQDAFVFHSALYPSKTFLGSWKRYRRVSTAINTGTRTASKLERGPFRLRRRISFKLTRMCSANSGRPEVAATEFFPGS